MFKKLLIFLTFLVASSSLYFPLKYLAILTMARLGITACGKKNLISVLATKLIDCVVCDVENVCHHGRVKIYSQVIFYC